MNDEHDVTRLAEIGDPFTEDVSGPLRSADPPRMAGGPHRSPGRAQVRLVRRVAFVSALLYEVAYLGLVERRPDLATVSPLELAWGLAIPLAAAALALVAATRRGARGLGLSTGRLAMATVAAPALFAIGTLAAAPSEAGDPLFWRHAAGCAAVTAILALGPVGLGLWAFRRAFVAAATWRTAAVGVAAGALAAATMSLACPISTGWHVIVGHGGIMLAAALAATWLAPATARS